MNESSVDASITGTVSIDTSVGRKWSYVSKTFDIKKKSSVATLRRKYRGRLHDRGVGTEAALRSLLGYVDGVTSGVGLEPGLLGVVQEPWERQSVDDGTGPGRDYRGKQTWAEVDEREAAARGR